MAVPNGPHSGWSARAVEVSQSKLKIPRPRPWRVLWCFSIRQTQGDQFRNSIKPVEDTTNPERSTVTQDPTS
jgi:hypothetical protein